MRRKFADYLHLRNIVSVTNGTIAIHMAIRALGLKGEIITTPLLSSLQSAPLFGGCTPVFVDIDPDTLNMDPS
ncbi:DegT/DnrJ/EryC1/StrS family aminotransferase, partial [Bacteroides cellulosilyticus]|uniref:DegT/DnrJ/EryC1/StrS family aminotransferase n=1 Tax=Bacteroides cellulosilyticus TaxID=246787 RepID=UPI001872564A